MNCACGCWKPVTKKYWPGHYPRDKSQEKIVERFLAKVLKSDDCWLWIGARYRNGYGAFNIGGRNQCAQRAAWILFVGLIPDGTFVLHRCDNPPCVNPEHLFLGTPKDNTQDMVQKGRSTAGEKHRLAKLTAENVFEIRSLHANGHVQRRIAEQFNVSYPTVNNIIKRKSWQSI